MDFANVYLGLDTLGNEGYGASVSNGTHHDFHFNFNTFRDGGNHEVGEKRAESSDIGVYECRGPVQGPKDQTSFPSNSHNNYASIVGDASIGHYLKGPERTSEVSLPQTVNLSEISNNNDKGQPTNTPPVRSTIVAPSLYSEGSTLNHYNNGSHQVLHPQFQNGTNAPYVVQSNLMQNNVNLTGAEQEKGLDLYKNSATANNDEIFYNLESLRREGYLNSNKKQSQSPNGDYNSSDESCSNKTVASSQRRGTPGSNNVHTASNNETPDMKRRRFLERNRIAASKCRQKKKLWTQNLEKTAHVACEQSKALRILVSQLREEVICLKNQLLAHQDCNCEGIRQYLSSEAQGIMSFQKH
ncbi:Transcription factor atf21 [Schizosaccharomyces pombe]